jgi:hypothetical protein
MGIVLMLIVTALAVYMVVKAHKANFWHNQGVGERSARAEYARLQREQPGNPEARLSEAEFVQQHVASRPGMWRYIVGALLLVFIGLPVSCTIGAIHMVH